MSLYRRRTSCIAALGAALSLAMMVIGVAQTQRRKPHKLRATALVELTTDAKNKVSARLIPVTILDQGVFQDASTYKAAPRPLALEQGVVYEVQKSGQPIGFVTVTAAGKDTSGDWSASGRWQPPSAPKPEATPAAVASDERPRLRRAAGSSVSPPAEPSPSPSASPSPSPAAAQPSPSPSAAPTPAPVELSPLDPDRPVLRRGKPETHPEPSPSPKPGTPAAPLKLPPGAQRLIGVSDTETSDSRSYELDWKETDRAEMEAKMRRLALAQLPRQNPPLTERSLTHVTLKGFDLDLSNEPVLVLMAEFPVNSPGRRAPGYLTLIARVDMEGAPQKLDVSLTDASRLDVTPRLELIDAVDVDGDGVAELLFREYGFDSKNFVIFRAGRSTVTKVFEGAGDQAQ